ncbi:hypothetical protein CCP4SC76_4310005 [Gammaproteobacteria bacterium]
MEVYSGNQLVSTFMVPKQDGTLWTVFEIGQDGHIVPVNQMSYPASPQFMKRLQSISSGKFDARLDSNAATQATDYWQMLFQPKKGQTP